MRRRRSEEEEEEGRPLPTDRERKGFLPGLWEKEKASKRMRRERVFPEVEEEEWRE